MASLSLYSQFETNLMSNRNVIELPLQLKSTKAHGKNYIRAKAHLVRHVLRNRLLLPCSFDSDAYSTAALISKTGKNTVHLSIMNEVGSAGGQYLIRIENISLVQFLS